MPNHKSTILNPKFFTGFTLIELIVSMGIFMLIVGFSGLAYLNIQKSTDLTNQTTQLISSFRQAQALAIGGQTLDDASNTNVGIHFEEDSYTIFIGSSYDPNNTSNIITNLPNQIAINYILPSANLLFTARTGEINVFDSAKNIITIIHQDGQSKTINFNRLGIVDLE